MEKKKKGLRKFLKKVALGAVDMTPLGGIANNVKGNTTEPGTLDKTRLVSSIVVLVIVIAVIAGWLGQEEAEDLIEITK